MMVLIIINAGLLVLLAISHRNSTILEFKVSYYEAKLENRGVDISQVKGISKLKEITDL